MSSALSGHSIAQLRRLAQEALADWRSRDALRLLFVLRTVLAAIVALGVSMALSLGAPSTAMVTVFIVAAPRSGDVIAKGFYRISATLVGAVAAVTLVATLVEYRTSFLVALSLWIGLCTTGAAYVRGYRAYGFVLAGYTVTIIAVPAIAAPDLVFNIAVMRATEVLVGIVSTALIADLLLPEYASHTLRDAVSKAYADLAAHARSVASGRWQPQQRLARGLALAETAIALELRREAASFESAEIRLHGPQLRRFADAMSRADSELHGWSLAVDRLRAAQAQTPNPAAMTALNLLGGLAEEFGRLIAPNQRLPRSSVDAAAIEPALAGWREQLSERAELLRPLVADPQNDEASNLRASMDFDALAERLATLVDRYIEFTSSYADFTRVQARAKGAGIGWLPHTDGIEAIFMGLRGAVGIGLMSMFWIATDWPRGPSALVLTAVSCTLFATLPQPKAAVRGLMMSVVLAGVLAVVVKFGMLPHADDFVSMALVLAPFLAFCAWITVIPKTATIGRGVGMFFPVLLGMQSAPDYDLAGTINEVLGALTACALAIAAFTAIVPLATDFSGRLRRSLWRYAARTCDGDIDRRRHRLDHGVRELLTILVGRNGPQRPELRPRLTACALAVLEAGHAVLAVREAAARRVAAGLSAALLEGLAEFLADPRNRSRARSIVELEAQEQALLRSQPTDASKRGAAHELPAALRQLRLLLSDERWYADLCARSSRDAADALHSPLAHDTQTIGAPHGA
ncbi:FUSC family protein [Hydrocarboniphaga effusa]|uniref:FUSC family protein n=1 Tax=Hydrocarboniphaga effusa TaxID=243629 RepID=UPI003137A7B1